MDIRKLVRSTYNLICNASSLLSLGIELFVEVFPFFIENVFILSQF